MLVTMQKILQQQRLLLYPLHRVFSESPLLDYFRIVTKRILLRIQNSNVIKLESALIGMASNLMMDPVNHSIKPYFHMVLFLMNV